MLPGPRVPLLWRPVLGIEGVKRHPGGVVPGGYFWRAKSSNPGGAPFEVGGTLGGREVKQGGRDKKKGGESY